MTQDDLQGVRWVRLTFVDVFGTSNSLQLPAERFAQAVTSGELFDGSALQGRARSLEADMRLRPDPATIRRTGELARVACTVLTPDGMPWPGDPRTALVGMLDADSPVADLGAAWTAATELELYLFEGCAADHAPRPLDRAGYFDDREGQGMSVIRAAAERLGDAGVDILSCHHEAGPGQYELDIAPLSPLDLADALVLAKQTVREVASEAGIVATFMPRPLDGEAGSGLHLNQQVDGLLDDDGRLSEDGNAFVAGFLTHARALAALASPTVNSYKRLHAGAEAPGAAVWAHVNRAALIRIGAAGSDGGGIEYRAADPSANPYLLVAGILVAAADGLANGLDPGPPLEEVADSYDPARNHAVRYQPLPRSLDEALDALLADDVFIDAFDHRLLANLVDGRRSEAEAYRGHVTGWELDRYLDEG
jgi:glutamine synthetase